MARAVERAEVSATLDLALRIGEVFLSSGAGAADVSATMQSICRACGLGLCEADVTFTTLQLSYQPSGGVQQLTMMRRVQYRVADYQDLTEIDLLVTALLNHEVDVDEARSTLATVVSTGHPYPRIAVTCGWGFMGMGASIVIGGDWIVTLIAFVAAAGIDGLRIAMSRQRLPVFYQQAAGGLFATLLAVAAVALNIPVDPSLVVTAGIIMLLSGIAFMGAVQDALTGYYVTASARGLEAILLTGGVIAGVSGGLIVGSRAGYTIALRPAASGWSDLGLVVFGAALTSAAFAFASYSPLRALVPIAVVGGIGELATRAVQAGGLGPAWAAATSAVVIGLVAYGIAERIRVPPLIVLVCAIVPLLPGLSIFKGLFQMADGDTVGLISLATALAIALALASGVILGEYVAQPIRREAHRLEQRLSGPRLVGPSRAPSRRGR